MKTNKEIIDNNLYVFIWGTCLDNIPIQKLDDVMKLSRIDTLEDLIDQFKANQKKLSPIACIGLVEELIKDIKK